MADAFTCDECGRDFSDGKPTPGAALGLHRYREHGVRKAPAKKSPGRRRKVASRPLPTASTPAPEAAPVALFDASAEPEVLPRKRRFWQDWITKKEGTPGEIRPSKPGRPRKSHRTSFAPAGTLVWMGASQMAAGVGAVPVSRALSIQAGIAKGVTDKDNAQVRLGIALLNNGQKDAALKAFNKVTDPKQSVGAHIWAVYARTH